MVDVSVLFSEEYAYFDCNGKPHEIFTFFFLILYLDFY